MKKITNERLNKIFNYFGCETQRRKLMEETMEFLDEVLKHEINDYKITCNMEEEIADTLVLLNQFIAHYGLNRKTIEALMESKVNRTEDRMEEGYYI